MDTPSDEKLARTAALPLASRLAHSARARLIGALCALFLLAGLGCLGYHFFFLRFEESTDDAYVAGNLVRVSSQVTGSIEEICVDNTQAVAAGQVLLRLDDTDAALALERARSSLADAVRQVRSLMAESERLASLVELRRQELEKARGDLARRENRRTAMAVSDEELSHARDNRRIAEAAFAVARKELQVTRMLLQDKALREQPQVLMAAQRLREAWLAWKRCMIKSPVDGYVARRSAQVGGRVSPETALLAVVPLADLWVDANFKEVQISRMRIGQSATVEADIYGGSVQYTGTLVGLGAGTGSVFSLLPPENATGNWIKVVQRVPVKIALDKEQLAKAPLLVGLSCTVRVNVANSDGPMLAPLSANASSKSLPAWATAVFEHDPGEIDGEIDGIIRANASEKD